MKLQPKRVPTTLTDSKSRILLPRPTQVCPGIRRVSLQGALTTARHGTCLLARYRREERVVRPAFRTASSRWPSSLISWVRSGPSGSLETGKQSMVSMKPAGRCGGELFFGHVFGREQCLIGCGAPRGRDRDLGVGSRGPSSGTTPMRGV